MMRVLPEFLQTLLESRPRAGEGVHAYLFRVARQLHCHYPVAEIVRILETAVANCGRHVSRKEIEDAVRNSIGCAYRPNGTLPNFKTPGGSKWPEKNLERIEAICAEGYGLVDLWEASPIRIEDSNAHTEEIIDRLFPGNPLLCCGRSQSEFDTRAREAWRGGLSALQLIVPSPMSAITGLTQEGKESKHALSNTGLRRFLVVECDFSIYARDGKAETKCAPLIRKLAAQGISVADMCGAVLLHLAEFAPMVCAVHSGGKSVHGWFYVHGQAEEKLLRFMRYAVTFGGDPAGWSRSQFMRIPGGTRDNGNRQTVYFYHPQLLEGKP